MTTLLFVSPLFVVALSGPLLGERIRYGQWLAVGAGFAGVALVFRPEVHEFDWGMPLALIAAVCSALSQLVSRKLSHTDRPLVGLFYVTLVGTAVLGTLAVFDWRRPLLEDLALMVVMGLIAAAGHFAVFKAIELASPARLAPFYYLQIITAVALGYWAFGDIPDAPTLLGLTVIVAAGLVCLGMERVRRGARITPTRTG
jgi:drug/metabolite transporter (DMT)-like permease